MRKHMGKQSASNYKQQAQNADTMDKLRTILSKVVPTQFVQVNESPPYCIKYHKKFLSEFDTSDNLKSNRTGSQDNYNGNTQILVELDDDATMIPTGVTTEKLYTPEPFAKQPHTTPCPIDSILDASQNDIVQHHNRWQQ